MKDRNECMKELTTTLLNEVMQQEAENQIQARPSERTGKRKAHRNGTRSRSLKTVHGEIELDKPLGSLLLNLISKEWQQEKSRKYSPHSD